MLRDPPTTSTCRCWDPGARRSERSARSTPDPGRGRTTTRACCRISPRPSPPTWRHVRRRSSSARGSTSRPSHAGPGSGRDTLRKWERRYGVLRPSRTSGGQRRYDERDVARVEWLARPPLRGLPDRRGGCTAGDGPGERRVLAGRTAGCDRRRRRRDGHAPSRRPGRAVVHAPRRRDRRRGDRGTRSAADRRPLGGRRGVHRRGASAQRGRARATPDAPGRPPSCCPRHGRARLRAGGAARAGAARAGRPAPGRRLADGLSRHRYADRRRRLDCAPHGCRSPLPERGRRRGARGDRGRARGPDCPRSSSSSRAAPPTAASRR